ncbi:hypothetical protein EK21DRAFT_100501 [Setomelanomma holmii]|uniref:DUF7779 domain-containing protein n=1 Tax=Setomelanomma holmii TaxID=210430 RepID=A0A9P4H8W9_9PLEO|nr:hypothetical protein EK21DRAFT_100501 [Setomelanomma holmii]
MSSSVYFGDANAGFQASIINGNVDATFHQAPQRPETPPPPSIVIPFARNADFVERGTLLEQVRQRCAASGSRVALVGLGGVGKSQLAIEHAYRTHKQSPETWVFWVHTSNADWFEQSYRDVAGCVKITGQQDPQANIFELVHNWLRDCKHQWLVVLDNVDDARFLLNRPATNSTAARKPLREYLPHCKRGSILVTAQNDEAALKLVEQGDIVTVGPMDQPGAVTLFEKKLGTLDDSSKIAELVAVLEYMPLAIVQAAAYISQRASRYSEAKNSIIVTWQISFEHIQQTRPSAAGLLSLMSFFDRQGIPESLLRYVDSDEEDNTSQPSTDDDDFDADIVALRSSCFILVETDGATFEMHALKQQFVSNLYAKFPTGAYKNWAACQALFAHAKSALGHEPKAAACVTEWATVLYRAAWYAEQIGNSPDATTLALKSMKVRKKHGQSGLDSLESRAVGCSGRAGGATDHPDTLTSMANLASTLWNQGRWDAAEELFVQVMETSKKKLGADHPSTLTSMHNLAFTLKSLSQEVEAINLMRECVQFRKQKLRSNHPDLLSSSAALAQ